MKIISIAHKGLRSLIEKNDARGLPSDKVKRIKNILTALILASSMTDVVGPPGWRIHQLKGERGGQWSVSVSGNWRITFRIVDDQILDLNLEDYH